MLLNSGDFFAEQALLIPRLHTIENIGIELLALSSELIQTVKEQETSEEMINMAANSGLAYYANGESFRVVDNERLVNQIAQWWEKDELPIDVEPSIKHQVGMLVCKISGISDFILEKSEYEALEKDEADKRAAEAKPHLEDEELKTDVDGDDLGDTSLVITTEGLRADKDAANAA